MKYCDIWNRYQHDAEHVLSEEDAIAAQLHGDADQPDQKVMVPRAHVGGGGYGADVTVGGYGADVTVGRRSCTMSCSTRMLSRRKKALRLAR